MIEKINIKKTFDFFVFINLFILCCDSDNNLLFYLSLIGLIFSVLARGVIEKKIIFSKVNIWNYLFCGYAILSCFWSLSYTDSVAMSFLMIRRMALIFTLTVFIRDKNDVEKILFMYLICNFLMMLKISLRYKIDYNGPKTWDIITGNYFNTVAQFLAIGIIIAYHFFEKFKGKKMLKAFLIFFIFFAYYHIYLTGSRKGLVIPIIEFFIYRVIVSGLNLKKILINIMIFALGAVIVVTFLSMNEGVYERLKVVINMFVTGENGDESTFLRSYYIELAKEMLKDSPILGQGINSFPYVLNLQNLGYKYCHNNYYEILSGTGIIGFVLYYWFYVKLVIELFKRRKDTINVMGFSIVITLMAFEYGIVTYSVYIYPIILSILFILCDEKEKTKEENYVQIGC